MFAIEKIYLRQIVLKKPIPIHSIHAFVIKSKKYY